MRRRAQHSWLPWLGLFSIALCAEVPRLGEKPCPAPCALSGLDTSNWTAYHSVNRLKFCNEPMLLDFSAHTPLKDESKGHGIKACVLGNGGSDTPLTTSSSNKPSRTAAVNATKISVELAQWNALNAVNESKFDVSAAMGAAQTRMKKLRMSSVIFAGHKNAAVGISIGALVRDDIFRAEVIEKFLEKMNSGEKRKKQIAQLCDNHTVPILALE